MLFATLWDCNYLQYRKPIEHSRWREISFEDFLGYKKPFLKLMGKDEFAIISTTIKFSKVNNGYEVESLFIPCRSYVYNNNIYDETLLNHELYHFHITEFIARQVRKILQKKIRINEDVSIDNLRLKAKFVERWLQAKYDYQTNHGTILGKQFQWQEILDSSLIKLEEYSNSVITNNI